MVTEGFIDQRGLDRSLKALRDRIDAEPLRPELPDKGVRAVLGVPIHAASVSLGSLNVYRDAPHEWDDSEIAALESYALLIERLLVSALQAKHSLSSPISYSTP